MAALGNMVVLDDPWLDCGLARVLVRSPAEAATVMYKGARIQISPESPFAICSFGGASSRAEAVERGSVLLEEGLDMVSMRLAIDVATRDATDEYFAWWVDGANKKIIAMVDTGVTTFSAKMTVSVVGSLPSPPKAAPLHHPGLRFFRRSLVADDLFDAFRNMYLAFEVFLSTRYPKPPQQNEKKWLLDALAAASADVQLVDLAPAGHADPIGFLVEAIYVGGRLPLFHAKDGKTYVVPSPETGNRSAVAVALSLLTMIVMRMAESWQGLIRPRSGISTYLREAMTKAAFADVVFVASTDARFTPADSISSPSITSGIAFPAHFGVTFDDEPRSNVTGIIDTTALSSLDQVEIIHLINRTPVMFSTLKAPLKLTGFDQLQATMLFRILDAGGPRVFYPR
jgi:hypothetical protein